MISWNRYYDPEVGRYISADPIGLDGGMNLYGYVSGNPVNAVDLLGLADWLLPTGATPVFGLQDGGPSFLQNGGTLMIAFENIPNMHETAIHHDAIVDACVDQGIPFHLVNVPTMPIGFTTALGTNVVETIHDVFEALGTPNYGSNNYDTQ